MSRSALRVVVVTYSPGEALDEFLASPAPGHAGRSRSCSPTTAPTDGVPERAAARAPRRPAAAAPAATSATARRPTPALADADEGWAAGRQPRHPLRARGGRRAARRGRALAAGGDASGPAIRTPDGAALPVGPRPALAVDGHRARRCSAGSGRPTPGPRATAASARPRASARPAGCPAPASWSTSRRSTPSAASTRATSCTSRTSTSPSGSADRGWLHVYVPSAVVDARGRPRHAAATRTACSGCTTPARCATCPAQYPRRRHAPLRGALRAGLGGRMLLSYVSARVGAGCAAAAVGRRAAPRRRAPAPACDRRSTERSPRAPRGDHGRRLGHAAVAAVPGRAAQAAARRRHRRRTAARTACSRRRSTGCAHVLPGRPDLGVHRRALRRRGPGGAAASCAPTGWSSSRSPATPPTPSGSARRWWPTSTPTPSSPSSAPTTSSGPSSASPTRCAPPTTRWPSGRASLVTLGITPTSPATGFGYVQRGAPTGVRGRGRGGVVPGEARPRDRRAVPGVGRVPLELRHVRLAGADRARRARRRTCRSRPTGLRADRRRRAGAGAGRRPRRGLPDAAEDQRRLRGARARRHRARAGCSSSTSTSTGSTSAPGRRWRTRSAVDAAGNAVRGLTVVPRQLGQHRAQRRPRPPRRPGRRARQRGGAHRRRDDGLPGRRRRAGQGSCSPPSRSRYGVAVQLRLPGEDGLWGNVSRSTSLSVTGPSRTLATWRSAPSRRWIRSMTSRTSSSQRLPSLDGLRGLAAIVVVVHHALLTWPALFAQYDGAEPRVRAPGGSPSRRSIITWAGREAVAVFFILSGHRPGACRSSGREEGRHVAGLPRAPRCMRLYPPVAVGAGALRRARGRVPAEPARRGDVPGTPGTTST